MGNLMNNTSTLACLNVPLLAKLEMFVTKEKRDEIY